MSDAGTFNVLFGENVLSRNNLLPWWEKLHNYFVTLYVIFMVLFGVGNPSAAAFCVPADERYKTELTEPQAGFLSAYCLYQIDAWFNPITLRFAIVCTVFFAVIISNLLLETKYTTNCVNVYAKSQKEILKLKLPLQELKHKAIAPNVKPVLYNSPEKIIRDIVITIVTYGSGDPTHALFFRELFLLIILIPSWVLVTWLSHHSVQESNRHPLFPCVLEPNVNFTFSNTTEFVCTQPWSSNDWTIVLLYGVTIGFHCLACMQGIRKMKQIRRRVGKSGECHGQFAKAKQCMLPIAELSVASRGDERIFVEFVKFLFDKSTLNIMERSICIASGVTQPEIDQEFIEILAFMKESQLRKDNMHDISDIVPLEELIAKRKWLSITLLLNSFKRPFGELTPLEKVASDLLDDSGRNILFYALNRNPGFGKFSCRSAKCILQSSEFNGCFVFHGGKQEYALEFVKRQFQEDPTYPEETKDELISLIEEKQILYQVVKQRNL